ncbi:uncharacterized protein LOC128983035 isoform X2 [Macrosteles quadrilineatus]|uniref:uncharacterized protein LOC128983035 isoform X2 n=1 Tax=Macrosteles quadrilineatus TaxID=74068 RepID=UPI0023E22E0C|nr:uncharacterized protein LOC128983035 isoform X2 [Macrosteles quadrilineatus]
MTICLWLRVAIKLCLFLFINCERREEEIPEELAIYTSYEKLIAFFRNESDPLAKEILETFLMECANPVMRERAGHTVMRPVIVIEGNHRSSREMISAGLAEMMNARLLSHPAPCIHRYHSQIPKGTLLRRAYYLLSDYAVSFFAKGNSNRPIVINGYWTEKFAFTLAQFYGNESFPPITSDVFNWPQELLKPDYIFYLNFPQTLLPRHVSTKNPVRWKKRMADVFEYLKVRHPIVIKDVKSLFKLTTEDIHRHIRKHFYDKFQNMRQYYDQFQNANNSQIPTHRFL